MHASLLLSIGPTTIEQADIQPLMVFSMILNEINERRQTFSSMYIFKSFRKLGQTFLRIMGSMVSFLTKISPNHRSGI